MDESNNKMGRPTKYEERFCKMMFDELSKGHSIQGSAPVLGVVRSTIYEWADKYPDFSDSISRGIDKGLRTLEGRLLALISGQKVDGFNPRLCSVRAMEFILKTRYHTLYGDKKTMEENANKPIKLSYNLEKPPGEEDKPIVPGRDK